MVRGRNFNCSGLNFAELVLYKLPAKGPMHDPDGNMGSQWAEGVFLGYSRSSNTYIVHNADGITTARTMRRRPESERWSADRLASLQATPWSIYERPATRVRFRVDAPAFTGEEAMESPAALRHMRINKDDLDRHGYTDGCVQCTYIRRHGRARPGATHSHTCRARVMEAISQTEAGQRRIAQHDERTNELMARELERADKLQARAAAPPPTEFLPAAGAEASASAAASGPTVSVPSPAPRATAVSVPSPAPRATARRTSTAASSNSQRDITESTPNPREEMGDALDDIGEDAMECEDPTNFTDGDDNMLSSLRNKRPAFIGVGSCSSKVPHDNAFTGVGNVSSDSAFTGVHPVENMPQEDLTSVHPVDSAFNGVCPVEEMSQEEQVVKDMKESIMWRRCLSCLGYLQPDQDDVFSQKLLGSIGHFQTTAVISEHYSPPRITAELK